MANNKTVKVDGGYTTAVAVITEPGKDGYNKITVVTVGDFVRIANKGESFDGIVKAIYPEGFVLGWFDNHNHSRLDGFDWDDTDIIVY